MRDVFYTILVVWIISRVFSSISAYGSKKENNSADSKPKSKRTDGQTSVDYIPPVKKKISDDEGEYVDYEDVK